MSPPSYYAVNVNNICGWDLMRNTGQNQQNNVWTRRPKQIQKKSMVSNTDRYKQWINGMKNKWIIMISFLKILRSIILTTNYRQHEFDPHKLSHCSTWFIGKKLSHDYGRLFSLLQLTKHFSLSKQTLMTSASCRRKYPCDICFYILSDAELPTLSCWQENEVKPMLTLSYLKYFAKENQPQLTVCCAQVTRQVIG